MINSTDHSQVFIDDELCDEITYVAGQAVYVLECGGMVGDSVTVTLNGARLELCEVEVYGELANGKMEYFTARLSNKIVGAGRYWCDAILVADK